MKFFRGLGFGVVLAIPLWAIILFAGFALAGCSARHDDGMGDLWKGVKYVVEEPR